MKPTEARYVKVASGRFFLAAAAGGTSWTPASCASGTSPQTATSSCTGDAAFCSDECRQDQMEMDAALKAVARRHRVLRRTASSPAAAAATAPGAMARRPTIASLAAHASIVSG
ncbi:hypothetical protein ACP4OV_017134 [Aristida adscensionis]